MANGSPSTSAAASDTAAGLPADHPSTYRPPGTRRNVLDRRTSTTFSEELYRALMRTPFWALSILLHAILYLILYNGAWFYRPPEAPQVPIEAILRDPLDEALEFFQPDLESSVEPETVPEPELEDTVADEPDDETPLLPGENYREAFRSATGGAAAGDGLREVGFGDDIWGTEFGEHIQSLRSEGLDVVFLFDSTSSMSDILATAKENISWMITVLHALVPGFRLGIATYRDYGDEFVVQGQDLSVGRYRLMTYLDTIRAVGGGDPEEAVLAGLRYCEDMEWKPGAQRVVVLIGDAPPHRREARDATAVARQIHRAGGTVHAVVTFDPKGKRTDPLDAEAVRTFKDIARSGGGTFASLARTRDLVPELLVLSFGERWREEIEMAYEKVARRDTWRYRYLDKKLSAGDFESVVRKLRLTPIYPGLVELLLEERNPELIPRIMEAMQARLPNENLWAGVYILARKLGMRFRELPGDPRKVLELIEARHRRSVGGSRALRDRSR